MNDIVLNKKESIERCVRQIKRYYAMDSDVSFEEDYLKQDAIAINIQRACEQAIDLANYTIKVKKIGLPRRAGRASNSWLKNTSFHKVLQRDWPR